MKLKTLTAGSCTIALLAGCGAKGDDARGEKKDKTIHVDASVTLHTEILKHVKLVLGKEGYRVEIEEFADYVKPNQVLVDDELSTNFFQHKPYLIDRARKTSVSDRLISVFAVHSESLGTYSNNHTSLKGVADGQRISVPDDPINDGRALKLLADNGIIILKEGRGVDATKQDIKTYNRKVEITKMQAKTCVISLPDVDFAVVNGNNALNAKTNDRVLMMESKDSEAAQTYTNIIAIQTVHKGDEKIEDLIAVLNTEDVKRSIEEKYNGIVVPLVPVDEQKERDIDAEFIGILYLFLFSAR